MGRCKDIYLQGRRPVDQVRLKSTKSRKHKRDQKEGRGLFSLPRVDVGVSSVIILAIQQLSGFPPLSKTPIVQTSQLWLIPFHVFNLGLLGRTDHKAAAADSAA
jgi:hypothetical protein